MGNLTNVYLLKGVFSLTIKSVTSNNTHCRIWYSTLSQLLRYPRIKTLFSESGYISLTRAHRWLVEKRALWSHKLVHPMNFYHHKRTCSITNVVDNFSVCGYNCLTLAGYLQSKWWHFKDFEIVSLKHCKQ